MKNTAIVKVFQDIADLLELKKEVKCEIRYQRMNAVGLEEGGKT